MRYYFYKFLERFSRYRYIRNKTACERAEKELFDFNEEEGLSNPHYESVISRKIARYSNRAVKWHLRAKKFARERRVYENGRMKKLGDCCSKNEAEKFEEAGDIQDFEVEAILREAGNLIER